MSPARAGLRDAFVPALTLGAGYVGFGALAAGYDLPLIGALLSTLVIWALPGQLILVEMHAGGAAFLATFVTVVLSSARFLPMTVTLIPMLAHERRRGWHYYAAAQLIAMTGWAMAMARFPDMPARDRFAWFASFAALCLGAATASTAIGYLVADALTPVARLGLVFLAPIYYLLILLGSLRGRVTTMAFVFGAVAGPLAHLLTPDWSVLLAGLTAGTLAWAAQRALARRAA